MSDERIEVGSVPSEKLKDFEPKGLELKLPGADHPWAMGHILRFTTGVIGVPIESKGDGWWRVKVVGGDHPAYPVGGYDIQVSPKDIDGAERIVVS